VPSLSLEQVCGGNGKLMGLVDVVVTDPDAPGFDLEALFKAYEK
jgi:hypothetical protein